jgi:hypothetical protein
MEQYRPAPNLTSLARVQRAYGKGMLQFGRASGEMQPGRMMIIMPTMNA